MIAGIPEQEFVAYLIFGLILNFLFSMLFGLYLSRNIGIEEMARTKGDREQPWWIAAALFVPYAKMLLTLYRVAILQIFFLDRGHSHKEFWIYLTTDES